MPRMMDNREVYRRLRVKYPEAYIAIQQGEFVSFLADESREISSLLGEMLVDNGNYKCISIHKLRFENFANRLVLAGGKPVVWAEKIVTLGGKGSFREVNLFSPRQDF